jgi:polyphosphate kinase 2 (PPK2 family)
MTMGKKAAKAKGGEKKNGKRESGKGTSASKTKAPGAEASGELSGKEYAREMKKLHVELVKLQQWVLHKGLKVCVVFEGRDGAGKGGTIKAITERVSPRVFRVVALPAPTEREKSQMYVQRYLPHLPAGGEVVIFDRSWYNRAGVERVMGFCTDEQAQRFLKSVPLVESAIVNSGVILLKYWLEVSPEEQTRRLEDAHRRRPQAVEAHADGPQVVHALGRLLEGARRHVRGDRHLLGAVVRRDLG